MRQFFRNTDNTYSLGNTELVARMLATANKEGRYADSDIYGAGLLDLDAATAPFGDMMAGMLGSPEHRPLAGSGIALSGGAFGSSLQRQFAGIRMVGFDSLDAPFAYSTADLITSAEQSGYRGRLKHQHSHSASENLLNPNLNLNNAKLSVAWEQDGSITNARLNFNSSSLNPSSLNPSSNRWWVSYGQHGGQSFGVYAEPLANRPNGEYQHQTGLEFHTNSNVNSPTHASSFNFSDQLAFAAPYLSLVRDGPGIGWSHDFSASKNGKRLSFALTHGTPWFDDQQKPQDRGERGLGALLEVRLRNGFALQAGAVHEADGFLGARVKGALGDAHAATTFIGGSGNWELRELRELVGAGAKGVKNKQSERSKERAEPWRLLASAYFGRTRPELQYAGLIRDTSDILSSAFSLGVARSSIWRLDDWLGLRVSQPLRAETGTAQLRVPVGRNKHREVSYQHHELDLTPEGRNLQAEIVYRLPIAGGALRSSFGIERHPQHNPDSDIQPFMQLSFERQF